LKVRLTLFVDGFGPWLERDVDPSIDRRSTRFANACQVRDDARIPRAFSVSKIRTTIG
jgi:hypothetical protein